MVKSNFTVKKVNNNTQSKIQEKSIKSILVKIRDSIVNLPAPMIFRSVFDLIIATFKGLDIRLQTVLATKEIKLVLMQSTSWTIL